MNNITYILGAGASYNALPVLATMKDRMLLLLNHLKEKDRADNLKPLFNVQGTQKLYDRYHEVVIAATTHHTPDTYAKKLSLMGGSKDLDNLALLKQFLQLYFLFEQDLEKDAYVDIPLTNDPTPTVAVIDAKSGKSTFESRDNWFYSEKDRLLWKQILTLHDDRYDVLLASLLQKMDNDELRLPKHVNILSWNYDLQLELAYINYIADPDLTTYFSKEGSDLKNIPGYLPNTSNVQNKVNLIKLNGGAAMHFQHDYLNFKTNLEKLISGVGTPFEIKYAWEKEDVQIKNIEKSKEIIAETDKLVIIGYSFPNFNREVDNEILKSQTGFDEIFIQDPNEDAYNNIKESLINILGSDFEPMIKHKRGVDQFHIPF